MSMWRALAAKSSPWVSEKLEDPSSSPSPSPSSSSIFRCSSFKDIENICIDSDSFFPTTTAPRHFPGSKHRHQPLPSTPRRSIFHRVRTANTLLRHWAPARSESSKLELPPDGHARIVVYYTSLRVIRTTSEACRAVLSILQGFRVAIDERDVAMDSGFTSELRERLGSKEKAVTLPRVFIDGRYIGGADEVYHLNETGELRKLLQGLPQAAKGTCGTCGGYKFILCGECSGSHKIFSQKLGISRLCTACNENGLIRCPRCCCSSPNRPILAHPNGC